MESPENPYRTSELQTDAVATTVPDRRWWHRVALVFVYLTLFFHAVIAAASFYELATAYLVARGIAFHALAALIHSSCAAMCRVAASRVARSDRVWLPLWLLALTGFAVPIFHRMDDLLRLIGF